MATQLVLFPSPAVGHLVSMVELAKRLLHHNPTAFSITILTTQSPFGPGAAATYIANISALFIGAHKQSIAEALKSLSPVRAFITDLFCTTILDTAAEAGVPAYNFFTSGASLLSLMLYLPTLHDQIASEFTDLKEPVAIPEGILVNTFEEFEPQPLKALPDGQCLPGHPTPPVYAVGPLLNLDEQQPPASEPHECLKWLGTQPDGSVLFLCFGSWGAFEPAQAKEIALGLEQSGHRFLWSLRGPPKEKFSGPTNADLEVLLPEGFIDRTRERGMVWPTWVPQVAVLAHPAVGGFVSHCGWNSILESVWHGVPILAFPLYAEQRLNAWELVKDMGVGVGVDSGSCGLVKAEKLEKAVRRLMEAEEGQRVRRRGKELKEAARKAVEEGGPSYAALATVAGKWVQEK
ncbi:anthocyanidin 5,3-O-glucosyltransferase [Amborella trichopoda]|uniref:anthocyanidin 5,3-O-glucosyltransferase n=1 Tax=Amborella trichopoda TaxID=13333 RepID=UPI0009C0EB1C|nr:anthocyanidin 5,3-O-glucosyltransferase [Amborella trichopoda]|eukprot:XP_020531551.1 anthocyanidin 5,3-O-glucosyltransferase [Amborella trichopoda]